MPGGLGSSAVFLELAGAGEDAEADPKEKPEKGLGTESCSSTCTVSFVGSIAAVGGVAAPPKAKPAKGFAAGGTAGAAGVD